MSSAGRPPRWTDGERERVAELLLKGKSMGKISRLMGLTRNMVIGRIHRDGELHAFLGRKVAQKHIERDQKHRMARTSVPVVPALNAHNHVEPFACEPCETIFPDWPWPLPDTWPQHCKPLVELQRGDCRWPVADVEHLVGGHMFCAEPRAGEFTPYCDKHHRRAHDDHPGP